MLFSNTETDKKFVKHFNTSRFIHYIKNTTDVNHLLEDTALILDCISKLNFGTEVTRI